MTKTPTPASHAVNTAPDHQPAEQLDALMLAMHLRQRARLTATGNIDALSQNAATVLAAQHEHIRHLEAQLSAIGAGGVEPLRKPAAQPSRECLQQSAKNESLARELTLLANVQDERYPNFRIIALEADAALQAAPPAPAGPDPVLYVSPEQLAKHSDPEGAESAEFGRYLPTRKTPAGKFTQPLYAGPPAPAGVAVRAMRKSAAPVATLDVREDGNLDYETCEAGWLLPAGLHHLYAAPAQAVAVPAEVDLPDVEDMAHSAMQDGLSYGFCHDVFQRWMRAVMDKTVQALAVVPAPGGERP